MAQPPTCNVHCHDSVNRIAPTALPPKQEPLCHCRVPGNSAANSNLGTGDCSTSRRGELGRTYNCPSYFSAPGRFVRCEGAWNDIMFAKLCGGFKDRKSTRLKLQSPVHLVCRLLLEKKK